MTLDELKDEIVRYLGRQGKISTIGNHWIKLVYIFDEVACAIIADLKFTDNSGSGSFDTIEVTAFSRDHEIYHMDGSCEYWQHTQANCNDWESNAYSESVPGRFIKRPAWTRHITWHEFLSTNIEYITNTLRF